jgi:phosphohistidine phosphatase
MRHGEATRRDGSNIGSANEKTLTDNGIEESECIAKMMLKNGCEPDVIVSSPIRRAVETATLMNNIFEDSGKVIVSEELRMGCDPHTLFSWLKAIFNQDILLVGHMPDVSNLTSFALTGSFGLEVVFFTSTVCCISFENGIRAGKGLLEWLIHPELI